MSLEGKVAIVTGSARGLGRDYARLFARDGALVVVADILAEQAEETVKEINDGAGKAIAARLDVTDLKSAQAMADKTVKAFGRIDILVNNAGIWGDLQSRPCLKTDPEYWDLVLAVNLKGPLLCAQAVVPHMKTNNWGRIVNISSMGAIMRGGAYGASKLALNHLTYSLAHEVGSFGITVNGVGPGATLNEATRSQVPEAAFNAMIQQQPIKRPGTGDDQYGAIKYLCSDDAAWVTGQTIYVNGGFNTTF